MMSRNQNDGISEEFVARYNIRLQPLATFRKIQDDRTSDVNLEIPAPSRERIFTDKKGFLFYGAGLLICLPIMIHLSMQKADVRVLLKLFEPKNNSEREDWRPEDPYQNLQKDEDDILGLLKFDDNRLTSKREAPYGPILEELESANKTEILKQRVSRSRRSIFDYTEDPWVYCGRAWWKFLLSFMVTIACCTSAFYLIKFLPHTVIWLAIAVIFFWLIVLIHLARKLSDTFDKRKYPTSPQFLIVMLCIVCTVTWALFLFFRRHVIQANCLLYQQTSRAILPMFKLLQLTLPTALVQLLVLTFSVTSAIHTLAPSKSSNVEENRFEYTDGKTVSLLFNIFITNWTVHFVEGFLCMVTAGTVASRYFSSNQEGQNLRISKNFANTFKYHLGTVALGSAIQPVVDIVYRFARFCSCYSTDSPICFLPLEMAVAPLSTRNTYIMTALHGQPYWKSGRRVFSLLLLYAPFLYSVTFRGGIILLALKLDLVLCCTGFSYLLFSDSTNVWLPTILCLLGNFVVVSTFLETFETAAHTLLISRCEEEFIKGDMSRSPHPIAQCLNKIFEKCECIYELEVKDRGKDMFQVRCY